MSKKITSFLVMMAVVLFTLPSQAQVLKKVAPVGNATEMRVLKKNLNVNPAEMAKQKQMAIAKAAKENAKAGSVDNLVIGSWDYAAHAPKAFAPNKFEKVGKLNENLKVQREFKAGDFNAAANRAATVDANGIITEPEEGEHKYYTREGLAYFASGMSVYYGEQSGYVETVQLEDGTVYVKDIVSYNKTGAWVKGTIANNVLTIPAAQPVSYDASWDATLSLYWGTLSGSTFVKEEGDITFAVEGDVLKLVGSDENHVVSIFWDDDDSWTGNADYETVWTLDPTYEPPMPIVMPEGATVENWYADGTTDADFVPEEVNVAFVDDEVYVSGLFVDFPTSCIKGTVEGDKVIFPTLQYIGFSNGYAVDCWTYAANYDPITDNYVSLDAVTFTYDAEAKTLTLDPDQILALNAAQDRLYYITYINELVLSANPIEREIPSVPYTYDFTTKKGMRDAIVIDANGDFTTWGWNITNYAYYVYNMTNVADDYLVLPIQLEANKNYNVTINASNYMSGYPEKFEVKAGKAATVEALNKTVIGEETLNSGVYEEFEGSFTTDEAGVWYVAVHATSDPDQFYLMVKSLTIDLGADAAAPGEETTLELTVAGQGKMSVTGKLTAPAKSVNGEDLVDNLDSIQIVRNGEVISIFKDVAPSAVKNFVDDNFVGEAGGLYTYQAIPYNAYGKGMPSEKVTVYVGIDTPNNVENVQIVSSTANDLTLTWDPVTTGVHGGYLGDVKYTVTTIETFSIFGFVFFVEGEELVTVDGTTATIESALDEGEPRYDYYGVKAVTATGKGDATAAVAEMLAGAPYELPFTESFAGRALHYVWSYNANAFLGVSEDASDGDDCALALSGNEEGDVTFESFKLNLKANPKATVLFDAKKNGLDEVTIYAITPEGETSDVKTIKLTDEYVTYEVALPASLRNHRWGRFGFKVKGDDAGSSVLLDNIRILNYPEYDLAASLSAPKSVLAGTSATIKVTVENKGKYAAESYVVKVNAGDDELAAIAVNEKLEPFTSAEFTTVLNTSVFDEPRDLPITATVIYINDLNPDNDVATGIITIKEPTALGVTTVTAEQADGNIVVSWTAPNLDAVDAEEVTEDFEEGTGGWTFVDADGDGFNWMHHVNTGTGNWSTHSGDGAVGSESYSNDYSTALTPDNWLISPDAVLDGTFKFWAIGQDASYCAEHFQVFVSTTSATDLSTFEPVGEEFVATGEYKEYSVDLSEYKGVGGWIAIRHYHVSDEFVLVVDDITYLAGTGVVEIDHFNIYLDGKLATAAAADEATATVENVKAGEHYVGVSVVYTNGQESKPVEVLVSVATGLDKITILTQPVDVYSLDGKLVRKQTTSFEGLKGVYVVDGKKVVLK